ncbi:MAG: sugar ABC transporter permease [Clostridia bacterium]|nr:sugar ABC transporter permease [Clostridia bacterium]
MKAKKSKGVETLRRRYGMAFVAPWVFGVVVFVLVPLLSTIWYSVSSVKLTENGLETTFIGFQHYKTILFENSYFLKTLPGSLTGGLTKLPIIVALSLILAVILNQKFRGRTMARAVFFLPVLIASSVVMTCMAYATDGEWSPTAGTANTYMDAINFNAILQNLNLPTDIQELLTGYLSTTFNLIWSCGVQTLLFVSGLQTIPSQLYEVSRVEGASAWETFWFVTVPMMGRIIQLVLFYTMIETFAKNTSIVNYALGYISDKLVYDEGSAMLWFYFMVVGVILGTVLFLYNRLILRRWE